MARAHLEHLEANAMRMGKPRAATGAARCRGLFLPQRAAWPTRPPRSRPP
jgi:hypothetical protein